MSESFLYYAALLAGIICGVAGQIALKIGAVGAADLRAQFLHPATIIGFAIYVLGACLYTIAIRRLPLSLAYPSVSLGYLVVALVAHFMWNEPLGAPQLGGIALITGGILLLHQ